MTNREMEKVFKDEVLMHNKIIYKICHQYTYSPEDLNDLYQEVMLPRSAQAQPALDISHQAPA